MSNQDVADDFVDKVTLADRLKWIANALFRAAFALLVALLFFTGLAALELRYEAEQALGNGQQGSGPQPELHRLLEGPPRVQGAAALGEANLRTQAEAAFDARVELDRAVAMEADRQTRLGEAERRLLSAAELANCGINPSIAAAQACTGEGAGESLVANLADAKTAYDEALNNTVEAGVQVRAMQVNLDAALRAGEGSSAGAPLAPAVPALREFDGLQSYMPSPVQPAVSSLFSMDTEVSILLVAFIAGLLGSTCLLFILITFPNYLPLTFGSGQHFFLRIFTGGAVAVLVVLLLRLGTLAQGAPTELAAAQSLLSQTDFSEPVRFALIGVIAGFFAEQIAKWAKDYADAAFHGQRTTAPAGTQSVAGQTYDAPPEGGPRPAQ